MISTWNHRPIDGSAELLGKDQKAWNRAEAHTDKLNRQLGQFGLQTIYMRENETLVSFVILLGAF